jgi:5-methylcytosine-specific restriction enzyme A
MSNQFKMKTFLLAWNPKRWQLQDIAEMSQDVKLGIEVFDRWSSGGSKKPKAGDRFFLIRLGEKPRGIIASGHIIKDAFQNLHWDEEKAALGEFTNYVEIRYNTLLNPETDAILPRDLLNQPPLSEMHWDTQMSGVEIPEKVANELEILWANFTNSYQFTFPEEIEETQEKLFEGAVRRVSVNAYERNPEARRICIETLGAICSICGFDFETTYGDIGKGFIHVHHLKQLFEIGTNYQVDPLNDLTPVCPNCHAIIHRQKPPYTIEEVKGFLKK